MCLLVVVAKILRSSVAMGLPDTRINDVNEEVDGYKART